LSYLDEIDSNKSFNYSYAIAFNNIKEDWYWSGTAKDNNGVWIVRIDNGEVSYGKNAGNYVWPVRSGQ
jgi:hypothetical protein